MALSTYATPPDPGPARTLDGLVERLRLLKVWAGDPSYEIITGRVNATWAAAGRPPADLVGKTTVVNCFRPGRRRLNPELVVAVVHALRPDAGYVTQWRQALRVVCGQTEAAGQVRVHEGLPPDLAGFIGRSAEVDQIRRALRGGDQGGGDQGGGDREGGAATIAAITGMAGVGKTQLAVHVAHSLSAERRFDRVLFVDLRGFHPDSAQPPADPAAVLDGFLRLLGMPGQQIPYDLPARASAYRGRLAGTRTLVVLDNAADPGQVRELLPDTAGCPVLVTSRRDLGALRPTIHLAMDVFTPENAVALLTRATAGLPAGQDPEAAARIAGRCGYLPLALGLVAAHIRATSGWTLTDHADRLDERHYHRHLDTGVELALDLSYQRLPADQRRLLRLVALHPGQDVDVHAAAALADGEPAVVQAHLDHLCGDHLLQPGTPGRYTFHDLVRAYAAGRAGDEEPPRERRAALTRLFDYYVAAAATATATLHPAEAYRRPRIPPTGTRTPALSDPDAALTWLDTERPTLIEVAAHTATHGWPTHTIRLSSTLFRYLNGGYFHDALIIHGHARRAADRAGDPIGLAHTLTNLGTVHLWLGRYGPATASLRQALSLFRQTGNVIGQARTLNNLGNLEQRLSRYQPAVRHFRRALALYREAGDQTGQARTLGNLGTLDERLGRQGQATAHYQQALALFRETDDRTGEGTALNNLGHAEGQLGRHSSARERLHQALTLFRQIGSRNGEAWSLDHLGALCTHLGRPGEASRYHEQALAIHREIGVPDGEASALNGLGEAAGAAGRPADALAHHAAALAIATVISDSQQRARAQAGLGHAHHALATVADHRSPGPSIDSMMECR